MPLWIPTPLLPTCNLSDLPSPPTAAHNLGLGVEDSPTFAGLTVNGVTTAEHYVGGGAAPTVAAGPGAGTNGDLAISIAGTDASMQVSLTFGSGAGVGALFTVTFATAFSSAPFPVFSAASAAAGLDIGSGSSHELYISATTTTLTVSAQTGTFSNGASVVFNIKT